MGARLPDRPVIEIEYCRRCRWLLRAAWLAQELLQTFEEELAGVTLVPSGEGGIFEIRLAGETIFSRREAGGFPEIRELKQRVRDRVAPGRDLGHIDRGQDQGHRAGGNMQTTKRETS